MDYNKLKLVEQHFHTDGHDFNRDARFNILKSFDPLQKKKNNNKKEKTTKKKKKKKKKEKTYWTILLP